MLGNALALSRGRTGQAHPPARWGIVCSHLAILALLGLMATLPARGQGGDFMKPIELPLSPLPSGLSSFLPLPLDNLLTRDKIDLGRQLFFDKRLSRDGTISCASCHQPAQHFTDGRPLPVGIDTQPGRRNVPSLVNSAYGKVYFWDGRAATLEEQALVPLTHPQEMGHTLDAIVTTLSEDSFYRGAFRRAFGSTQITARNIARALASYQRSLVAGGSPYDRYEFFKEESALSPMAQRGLKLFRGKARCGHCHDGPLFTDQRFHNTGVGWGKQPLDLGRFEHTFAEEDKGRFKTPTLRNVTLTAPYMHDGSIGTLAEVIDFYSRGGHPNPYLDPVIQPLNLSAGEKADLLSFLQALQTPSAGHSRPPRPAGGSVEPGLLQPLLPNAALLGQPAAARWSCI